MAKFISVPESENVNQLQFICPGCRKRHALNTTWQFNGDYDKPTVSPSVLVTWTYGEDNKQERCHSFIKNGMIQFLNDCTHELKGQIVELPEFDNKIL